MKNFPSFIVFAALVSLAAYSGSSFPPGEWYAALSKPEWTPANWIFPVAWTILYAMIAVAGWQVWKAGKWSGAIAIWALGLALNALWSYLMFGRHQIALALVDIAALWLTIIAFAVAAWPLDRRATYLFLPYLAWVSFAAALNFAVWQLN